MSNKKQSGNYDVLVVLGTRKSKVAKQMAELAMDHLHYTAHEHPQNYEQVEKGVSSLNYLSYGVKKVGDKQKHHISATPITAVEIKDGKTPILIEDPKNFDTLHENLKQLGLNPLYFGLKVTPNDHAAMTGKDPKTLVDGYKLASDVFRKNNIKTFPLMSDSELMVNNAAKHFIAHYASITGKEITIYNKKPAGTVPVAETEMVEA